ncbi:MAG: hypothetical protein DHS20C19_16680 [Acidimicrobiales bacterium]|nr:MAG: hypothetical protein DHS20C19_16680 [Acidimicrobiales bacterium]
MHGTGMEAREVERDRVGGFLGRDKDPVARCHASICEHPGETGRVVEQGAVGDRRPVGFDERGRVQAMGSSRSERLDEVARLGHRGQPW